MEKTTSNRTLWVLKRAEYLKNPEKRKSVVETLNRSNVDKKEPSIQTPNSKKNSLRKPKSISELPNLSLEKFILPKKDKILIKNTPRSMILDEKYPPNLPTIHQIPANMLLRGNFRNEEDLLSPSDLFESPLIKKRLIHQKKLDSDATTALTCRYNPEETCIALGCEDGITRVTDLQTNRIFKFKSPIAVPVTSVRWSPKNHQRLFQTKADGTVEILDLNENSVVFSYKEEGNFIFCSDHNMDGSFFSTAGQDAKIRVYDSENPSKVLHYFSRLMNPTHANRIYSLKFCDDNKNLIVSGGWDETLILWDIRMSHTANFIYGPLICGDSLDMKDQEILTGSWRGSKQIQIWDQRNLKEKCVIEWNNDSTDQKPFVYSCIFEKRYGKFIIAGSSGLNEIRIFENGRKYECLDKEFGFKKGIYSLDCTRNRSQFCYGSEKCGVYSIY